MLDDASSKFIPILVATNPFSGHIEYIELYEINIPFYLRLDEFHFEQRIARAVVSESHPCFRAYCSGIPGCLFADVDEDKKKYCDFSCVFFKKDKKELGERGGAIGA